MQRLPAPLYEIAIIIIMMVACTGIAFVSDYAIDVKCYALYSIREVTGYDDAFKLDRDFRWFLNHNGLYDPTSEAK